MAEGLMHLEVLTPGETVLDARVRAVSAVGLSGAFGLLPRHADIAAPLVPGILSWRDRDGAEGLAAVDRGVLLKLGASVRVTCARAVLGRDLATLSTLVEERFLALGEQERSARSAAARLEAGIIRRFLELEGDGV
jgi:F-type H+-transporting ATPase subunit epsilon